MALAHTIGNKAEAAYRRGDLFERRRAFMAQWQCYSETPKRARVVAPKDKGINSFIDDKLLRPS